MCYKGHTYAAHHHVSRRKKREETQWLRFVPDIGVENEVVNLYPQVKCQSLEGFGGAFTDSAGYVFFLMNAAQRQALLDAH